MIRTAERFTSLAGVLVLCWAGSASAQPVSFTGTYTENFNSMGAAGTAPPVGWTVLGIAGTSSTWTNTTGSNSVTPTSGIPAADVVGGTASTGLTAVLIDAGNPAGNNTNGYNAATGADPNNRTLATAPTGVAGNVLELQLTNNTGANQTQLTISYDIRRLQVGAAAGRTPPPGIPVGSDELAGYWLFYSRDNGTTFTNVSQLNPVGEPGAGLQVVVPNTVGTTTVPATAFTLDGPWNAGATLVFRWVDDNAIDPSPDPIYGLDNVMVAIAPVPEPAGLLAAAAVALLAARRAVQASRRDRQAAA